MTSTGDRAMAEAPAAGVERRRQLRQQRRRERLRNGWRILVLSGAAAGLGWLLLRQGWVVHSPAQIELIGSRQVSRDQVVREGQLQLPLQLLSLRPRQLADRLSAGLPVEQVQVTRLMLPPRLRIELVDREAVAQAQRRGPRGLEQGYVDRMGNWMSSRQQRGGGIPTVQVLGWQEGLRPALAMILARKGSLGSPCSRCASSPTAACGFAPPPWGTCSWARWTAACRTACRCCSICPANCRRKSAALPCNPSISPIRSARNWGFPPKPVAPTRAMLPALGWIEPTRLQRHGSQG